jgi:hypothetical protein
LGARTIPSSRRVPTCRPALPGGRFAPALAAASCRLVSDSNGSRRETFASDGSGAPAVLAGAVLAAFFTPVFFAGLAAAVATLEAVAALAGAAGAGVFGAGACAAGFAAAFGDAAGGVAGLAAGGVACAAGFAAAFGGAAGADWACKLLPAVASRIPVITVMARRMARSSLLTVFSPADPHPWLALNQQAS